MTVCDRGLTQSKLSIKKCVLLGTPGGIPLWVKWVYSQGLGREGGGGMEMENLETYCKQAMRKKVNRNCSKI